MFVLAVCSINGEVYFERYRVSYLYDAHIDFKSLDELLVVLHVALKDGVDRS